MADTRLMLHFNGANAATSTVDATGRHPTIAFAGTAALSTAGVKLGTACLLLDGDSDFLSIPNSEDFYIIAAASEEWTIDFLAKHDDHDGTEIYICQYQDADNYWIISHVDGSGLKFEAKRNGVTIIYTGYGGEISTTHWWHIALCRVGDEYGIYRDGEQVVYLQDASLATFAGSLYIGAFGTPSSYFDGRIDEVRIDKSNHFGAAPNAGKTDKISVLHSRGHYGLDDDAASTTVIDSSGHAYDGTLAGGDNTEDVTRAGQILKAFLLNGTDHYIDMGKTFEDVFKSSFSIVVSVAPTDGQPAANTALFGESDTSIDDNWVQVYIPSGTGKLRFEYASDGDDGNPAITDADVFTDGAQSAFTLLVFVADSTVGGVGGKKIYANGQVLALDSSNNGSTAGVTFTDFVSAENLYLGARNSDGSDDMLWPGLIDEVVIIPRALTAAEVLAIYTAAAAGNAGVDQEYEDYELLPEFPTLTRSPSAKSWSEQPDGDAVASSGYGSGLPLVGENFTFTPVHFRHGLEYFSDADKATLWTFHQNHKGRVFLWQNLEDNLKYQVIFDPKRPPKFSMAGVPGLWNVTMDLVQVNSQTVS